MKSEDGVKSTTAWQDRIKYKLDSQNMKQIECKAFGKGQETVSKKSSLRMFLSALM